jgi:hypothetical protein
LKKLLILTIVLLASTSAMGCVICKNIWSPFPAPTYSPTVASVNPTSQPTVTPSDSPKYITVETDSPPYQYMPNQARVSHPRYYRTADWLMPLPVQGTMNPAHHGVIHELEFWNPTNEPKTISVYNLKSAFYERKDTPARFVPSYEMFHDDRQGFYSEFTLPAQEHKTVLMYSYIADDANYDKYQGYFVEPVSISLIPDVPYT